MGEVRGYGSARALRSWITEYLLEWQLTDARSERKLQRRVNALAATVNSDVDVVCFVKPSGLCPFCNLATRVLVAAAGTDEPHFSLYVADLFHDDRESLREMLCVPVITWPVIFIRGAYVEGGASAVAQLDKDGKLLERVRAERAVFVPKPIAATTYPRPQLLHQAGGGPWRGCQTRIYGNVLRGIALLQICLLVPAHELTSRGHYLASVPLLALLALDSLMFTLFGPTPWSPLGCLATLVVWHRRGTVAPLIPYKVTFGGLYLIMNVAGVVCRLADAPYAAALVANASSTADEDAHASAFCELIRSDGLVWTMVTNSLALAIFRF